MKTIYCISGLGADEKVFSRLTIDGYKLEFVNWLIPENNETLQQYALRMSGQIKESNPILMGLSFGGMIAIEISKFLNVKQLILISSIKTIDEMPVWMRLAGKFKLYKIIPLKSYKILTPIQNYFLGVATANEKKLANQYRKNVSEVYLNWSVKQILNWKNTSYSSNTFHIHGSADKIFPIKNIKSIKVIEDAGHFMIYTKANAVSKWLYQILTN